MSQFATLAIALFVIFLSVLGFTLTNASSHIEESLVKNLQSLNPNLELTYTIDKRYGAMQFKDISFDDEALIDMLTIKYSPFGLKQKHDLKLDGIFLSGEIDINGKLLLNSLKNPKALNAFISRDLDSITINDLNFSLLSADLGGLRGVINITGKQDNDKVTWTGNIDTRQNQLELIATLTGSSDISLTDWILNFNIDNAKLERNYGKFTRVSGTASLQSAGTINANLKAGGAMIDGLPWQNARITVLGSIKAPTIDIQAMRAGEPNSTLENINFIPKTFQE